MRCLSSDEMDLSCAGVEMSSSAGSGSGVTGEEGFEDVDDMEHEVDDDQEEEEDEELDDDEDDDDEKGEQEEEQAQGQGSEESPQEPPKRVRRHSIAY